MYLTARHYRCAIEYQIEDFSIVFCCRVLYLSFLSFQVISGQHPITLSGGCAGWQYHDPEQQVESSPTII